MITGNYSSTNVSKRRATAKSLLFWDNSSCLLSNSSLIICTRTSQILIKKRFALFISISTNRVITMVASRYHIFLEGIYIFDSSVQEMELYYNMILMQPIVVDLPM